MSIQLYLAFIAASVVLTVIPGPMVTLIIANSVRHGPRAGLLNVAGAQLGLAIILGALVIGLASIVETMGWWFDWLRLAGAAYLVWLGWQMWRSTGEVAPAGDGRRATPPRPPRGGFFLQGLLVMLSNPKVLLFFGAFIPQFIDPRHDTAHQVVLLGATAMVIAVITDSAYAVLTGRMGAVLTRGRARLAARFAGVCLIGGGVWLALTRSR